MVYTNACGYDTMQRKLATTLIALLMISVLPAHATADSTEDIPTNAAATGVHDSLVAALAHAGLVDTLAGTGPFTVFAPTDQAFADAGIDLASFDTDAENQTLVDILTYHVVSGSVMSTDLADAATTDALNGDKLSFTVGATEVKVNDAVVTSADVEASNGVIHVIDKVLMPPVDVYVSDGTMANPYFNFYSDAAGTTTVDELDISKNYKFQRLSNPSAHPFYVGDSGYNTASSANLIIAGDGSSSSGISDAESFTLFFRDGFSVDDTLSYFCTVHSNMLSDFTITAPVELVDIPTVAASTGIHTALVAALAQADLVTTLQGDGPFTVFAPTDDAFTAAGIDLSTFDTDEENATLADILTYHVVAGAVMSTDLTDGMTATAVNTDSLTFAVSTDGVMVNDANVVSADVAASNGVIHVIDKVLMPPADLVDIPTVAAGTGIHDSLVTALTAASLVTTLQGDGPFTVFAPTDDAFAAAGIDLTSSFNNEEITQLTDILTYHVVAGQVLAGDLTDGMTAPTVYPGNLTFTVNSDGIMVNDANVISANVPASNGVIHVIDKVLMPPTNLVDIPTVATETGIHTALVAALAQANLVTTLQGDGPFTVFAPTDDAFTAAGIDLDAFVTDEEIGVLTDILLYHVVSSMVMSSDLSDGMSTAAFNSDSLTFTVSADGVMVNDANVVSADVLASNGVVHVIDKVLMPPEDVIVTPEDDCDLVVGITSDGYGFSPMSATINVGDTVCWQWTDESMEHNVKEVDGFKSTTYVSNGVYSGTPAATVNFEHTFTEDTTFYYACEPHIGMEMFGKITVGEGSPEPATPAKEDKEDNNTPGFLGLTAIIATLGAVLFARMRQDDEL